MDRKVTILNYLKHEIHAVISTTTPEGNPESALIGYGQTDDLEIIFGTDRRARKYKNIINNRNVSVVIGGWSDYITVQYEGEAEELVAPEVDIYKKMYHEKVPSAEKYANNPTQAYFKILPKWIRYSDFSEDKEQIFEVVFK